METRNVEVMGHRTSMRLEPAFWRALSLVARREGLTEHQVIALVYEARPADVNLSSALRSFLLHYMVQSASP